MSYRKIGDLIRLVDQRNKDLAITTLVGLTINKKFIPSVANTIGTDMSNYKIIRKNQFACSTMQVRRDKKMPVALLKNLDIAIISQAYPVFEVIDENTVLPDYLMLWFTRSEFDREACFHAVGGVRGSLEWEDFCTMELPIPSIEKQHEIVAQYEAVANKIKVNEAICEKLEATAQALYKQWFVDFEFPNKEGQPYKSSGGTMVFNEELEKEIPEGWEVKSLGDLLEDKGYIRGPFGSALKKEDMQLTGFPVYEQQHIIDEHRNFRYFISDEKYKELRRFSVKADDFIISCSGTIGKINIININDKIGVINQALLILRFCKEKADLYAMYYFLTSKVGNNLLTETSSGSAQINIGKKETIYNIKILNPDLNFRKNHNEEFKLFYIKEQILKTQNQKLTQLQSLLLSRLATLEG